jgi:hypothetical protein
MGKSSLAQPASMGDDGVASAPVAAHKSFGDMLGSYLMQNYPIAGGIEHSLFNPHQNNTAQAQQVDMLHNQQQSPMPDLISQNAQPRSGGLGAMILKALVGA